MSNVNHNHLSKIFSQNNEKIELVLNYVLESCDKSYLDRVLPEPLLPLTVFILASVFPLPSLILSLLLCPPLQFRLPKLFSRRSYILHLSPSNQPPNSVKFTCTKQPYTVNHFSQDFLYLSQCLLINIIVTKTDSLACNYFPSQICSPHNWQNILPLLCT